MIQNLVSPSHLVLIVAVALIVLGPKRLPDAGKALGSAIRGFKESLSTSEMREGRPAIESSREHDHPSDA
jgi:sec-independent protein translocase protein TatA